MMIKQNMLLSEEEIIKDRLGSIESFIIIKRASGLHSTPLFKCPSDIEELLAS